jgi:hypothetical protein
MRAASAVSRTVGPFAGGVLPTAVRSCRFRRILIKTLWRGRPGFRARTPALLPRRRRQVLKQRRASSRSAGPTECAGRSNPVPLRPSRSAAPRRPLDPAAASHDLQRSRRGFDQLQPNPGWVAERFKAPVLKFDGGRAVLSPFVPEHIVFNRLDRTVLPFHPKAFRAVSARLGPKLGPRPILAFMAPSATGAARFSRQCHRQLAEGCVG